MNTSERIKHGDWELVEIGDGRYRVKNDNVVSEPLTYEELSYDYPFLSSRLDEREREQEAHRKKHR